MLIVSAEQLQAQQLVVTRHKALDLVEYCEWIEGRELRLEVLRREPDGVTVGLAGLCAARLPNVRPQPALAERHERLDGMAHFVGKANDELEVRSRAGLIRGL